MSEYVECDAVGESCAEWCPDKLVFGGELLVGRGCGVAGLSGAAFSSGVSPGVFTIQVDTLRELVS